MSQEDREQSLRRRAATGDPEAQDELDRVVARGAAEGPAALVGRRVYMEGAGTPPKFSLTSRSGGVILRGASHWAGQGWVTVELLAHGGLQINIALEPGCWIVDADAFDRTEAAETDRQAEVLRQEEFGAPSMDERLYTNPSMSDRRHRASMRRMHDDER